MHLNANRLTELAYVAGLFDGEGCVFIAKQQRPHRLPQYCLGVTLSNTDLRAVNLMVDLFGGRIVIGTKANPRHRAVYNWQIGGPVARTFLRRIRRYLRLKGEQADLALVFQSTLTYRLRTPEIQAQHETMKIQLSALKRA